ncbi:hypothetical protein VNO77_31423 [Canavalia gladiata]|uniref:Uncharacterized protein n=1 Tax=Canavalia gladiata TaxID=3824 RepID=A0AAN9KRV8_CANGL
MVSVLRTQLLGLCFNSLLFYFKGMIHTQIRAKRVSLFQLSPFLFQTNEPYTELGQNVDFQAHFQFVGQQPCSSTWFHHQRVPLVILVCGTTCVGKSTIAIQLAQRLNLPDVLQVDMVYELLHTSTEYVLNFISSQSYCAPLASTPVWARDFSSSEELITEFCRECRVVRKGVSTDQVDAVSNPMASMNLIGSISGHKDAPLKELETDRTISKEKSGPKPIIVPTVLRMAEFDQKGLTVVNVSATTFPQTLDWLHGYLLQHVLRNETSRICLMMVACKDRKASGFNCSCSTENM